MKVPLSWIKKFIHLNASPKEIGEILTLAGLEVEKIEETNPLFEDVTSDAIFEISLTPNLGHCMSVLGVARELAAMLDSDVHFPSFKIIESKGSPIQKHLSAVIQNPEKCYRYGARMIRNIENMDSPLWLKKRLEACGFRSKNAIVDVTNYVMLEYGQPMHAFDYEKIRGGRISVHDLQQETSFKTLDDVARTLAQGTLVIADAEGPIAIAGIMGGLDSAVTDSTKTIALEAAYFNPSSIRKTSKALHLRSEGSSRHEKEIDPLGIPIALDRAAYLIQMITGGEILEGMLDVNPKPFQSRKLMCNLKNVNRLLGTKLSVGEVLSLLARLEIPLQKEEEGIFWVAIPSYRNDIKAEIDLIEEIARIYGYLNIEHVPNPVFLSEIPHSPIFLFQKEAREQLLAAGLQEFMTCDLISPQQAALSLDSKLQQIPVLQPSSVDQSILRTTLFPGLLSSIKSNQDFKCYDISAFEIGKVHYKISDKLYEKEKIAFILTGSRFPHHWDEKAKPIDFFDLKGAIENLFDGLNIPLPFFKNANHALFHPKRQALLQIEEDMLGIMGEIHPLVLVKLGIKNRVYFAEIDMENLLKYKPKDKQMDPLPQFPGSERDWTLTIRSELPMRDLFQIISDANIPLLKHFFLLDVYESEKLGADRKNITLRFNYRDDTKTVLLEEVEKAHAELKQNVALALKNAILES